MYDPNVQSRQMQEATSQLIATFWLMWMTPFWSFTR